MSDFNTELRHHRASRIVLELLVLLALGTIVSSTELDLQIVYHTWVDWLHME